MNMKKVSDYLVYAMSILAIVFSASSFVKVYANKTPLTQVTSSSAAPGQPVDLTFAAEKAVLSRTSWSSCRPSPRRSDLSGRGW